MAGSIFISTNTAWTVGTHAFYPIINRIRKGFPSELTHFVNRLFSPIDEGFDFVALDEFERDDFILFHNIVKKEYDKFVSEDAKEIRAEYRVGITQSWSELLNLMENDPRFSCNTG